MMSLKLMNIRLKISFVSRNQRTKKKLTMGGFEQRPWTPTKRRGPIQAEIQTPGPIYQLPQLLGKWRTQCYDDEKLAFILLI
jgi:hypothetical protein